LRALRLFVIIKVVQFSTIIIQFDIAFQIEISKAISESKHKGFICEITASSTYSVDKRPSHGTTSIAFFETQFVIRRGSEGDDERSIVLNR